ncbi:TetR/AcrR family transcriptional regulator [Bradyrhizobium sp. LMTR 3]|uniref:TetR/AcrR family transcriptional regulator n=1 Tax=Bradyrhizobium sp. LMTR 3 TaxID=189873 RepID=UPI000810BB3C|nr:TetR/AcrR family transcriptional regulator [Bradyrhizobium sp. LMTR 3]OCK55419.1 hypothetical protein LMTR3_11430 [Bradyrhizobium sp. LMTR 3]
MRKLDPVKHEKKRQEILGAAMRCFLRSGLKGASTAEICAEAGISPGHLYHYFDTRDAIVAALIEGRLEKVTEQLKAGIQGARSIVETLAPELEGQPGGAAAMALIFDMMAESKRNPEMGKIVNSHNRGIREILVEMLRYGQSRGEVEAKLDLEVAATTIMALMHGAKVVAMQNPKEAGKAMPVLRQLLVHLLMTPMESAGAEPPRAKKTVARARS